jgi:hypothetical protein
LIASGQADSNEVLEKFLAQYKGIYNEIEEKMPLLK